MRLSLVVGFLLGLAALPAHADNEPVVTHEPPPRPPAGEPLLLKAEIRSATAAPVGLAYVVVNVPGLQPLNLPMRPQGDEPGVWVAEVPAEIAAGELTYYLEAYDDEGNGPGMSGSAAQPLVLAPPLADPLLAAALDPLPPEGEGSRLVSLSLAGAAAVATVVGAVLGWQAGSLREGDVTTQVDGRTRHTLTQQAADRSNGFATGANVAFGVAGALAVGAGVTFAFDL